MTPEDFILAIAHGPAREPQTVQMARSVLVDGERIIDVANRYGCSRQNVHAAVRRVAGDEYTPADWQTRVISLPKDDMRKVIAIVRNARAMLRAQRKAR